MVFRLKILNKMNQGFIGGLFAGMGLVLVSDFLLYEFELAFLYLALGLFMVIVGIVVYSVGVRRISMITYSAETELRKAEKQVKAELAMFQKRIYQDDLCFEINMKPGRKNRPLMIVAFKKSRNFDVDKNEWVPKLSELEFLVQTLKRVAV